MNLNTFLLCAEFEVKNKTSVSSSYKENNFKPCLTKQLLNMFKLWCEWGIRHFKIEVSRQPQTSKCHVTSRLPSGLPFAVHVSTSGDLSCGK